MSPIVAKLDSTLHMDMEKKNITVYLFDSTIHMDIYVFNYLQNNMDIYG